MHCRCTNIYLHTFDVNAGTTRATAILREKAESDAIWDQLHSAAAEQNEAALQNKAANTALGLNQFGFEVLLSPRNTDLLSEDLLCPTAKVGMQQARMYITDIRMATEPAQELALHLQFLGYKLSHKHNTHPHFFLLFHTNLFTQHILYWQHQQHPGCDERHLQPGPAAACVQRSLRTLRPARPRHLRDGLPLSRLHPGRQARHGQVGTPSTPAITARGRSVNVYPLRAHRHWQEDRGRQSRRCDCGVRRLQ